MGLTLICRLAAVVQSPEWIQALAWAVAQQVRACDFDGGPPRDLSCFAWILGCTQVFMPYFPLQPPVSGAGKVIHPDCC